MTRKELIDKLPHMSNDMYFDLNGKQYNMSYTPVSLGNGALVALGGDSAFGYNEIGICQMPYVSEEFVQFFKTIDELLDNYIIDGNPLGEQLDNVGNFHCTVFA